MVDIYDFVFYTILKYDYSSSTLTGEISHDIIFGLMIPAIFVSMTLYLAVRQTFGMGHAFIGNLAAITGLGVIITLGWIPLIAGIGGFAFVALLALLIIGTIYRKIVPEAAENKLIKGAGQVGSKIDIGGIYLTEKQKRDLGSRLETCEMDYYAARKAIDTYGDHSHKEGSNIVIGESDFERSTEIERHSKLRGLAVRKAIAEVEHVPIKGRKDFIKRYTTSGGEYKGEFQKKLVDYFTKESKLEKKEFGDIDSNQP